MTRQLLKPLPYDVLENQRRAADPAASVWVRANAGSGKTYVLTGRVLRLLLAGVRPEEILCLTYTKAAAAEMRNRVAARLAKWALQSDSDLAGELAEITGRTPRDRDLERARTLFAAALETPGGLKIVTIHAFCESVLHRFPLEAGVPFGFSVLEEHEKADMILRAREAVLAAGLRGDPRLAQAVETLFSLLSDGQITGAIETALADSRRLRPVLADWPGARRRLRAFAHVSGDASREAVLERICGGYTLTRGDHDRIFALCPPKAGGNGFSDRLRLVDPGHPAPDLLLKTYLTMEGAIPKHFPLKAITKGDPALATRLEGEAKRLAELYHDLQRITLVERSEALLDVLGAISNRYESEKRARSLLDFDDLIERLGDLFADPEQADWVKYKLDAGITHILVDESQDTNPEQWRVVDQIVNEFFVGESAAQRLRTVFAVGDEKQSIYSFQGADPVIFADSGRRYAHRALEANHRFEIIPLRTSFRTLSGVLAAVDLVFADPVLREAVLAQDMAVEHDTARAEQGGVVTLWPPVQQPPVEVDPHNWPLEAPASIKSAPRQVAERIASEIAGWIATARPLGPRGRAVRADDVLILVQSRSALFHELIRALLKERLPTPGADRLAVTTHIAALDLLALGDVLLNPADDLQLAALLRSPLFSISEDALYRLAQPRARNESLWAALAQCSDPACAEAYEKLHRWRGRLDFDRPFEFFTEVLYGEGGLQRFHARLGAEVDDVLSEFLDLALLHERSPQPSLQGFLAEMRTRDISIKRDLAESGGGVRVMTVHGAKGLEAPIVILADAATKPEANQLSRPVVIRNELPGPLLIHAATKDHHTSDSRTLRDTDSGLQRAEYWRKLYVAMTRAEDELYVTGPLTPGRDAGQQVDGTWYEAIERALRPVSEVTVNDDGEETALLYPAERPEPVPRHPAEAVVPALATPLVVPKLAPQPPVPVIRPSSARIAADPEVVYETAAEAARDAEGARRYGTALHAILQHLTRVPPPDRERVLARALPELLPDAPEQHAALAAKARSILGRPELAHLFGDNSRAEVPFLLDAVRNGSHVRLAGRMDRVVVGATGVLVVDYKSDRNAVWDPGAVPASYRTQLGLYAIAARQLFPALPVEAAILWTELESLVKLPPAVLAEAAQEFTLR